MLAEFPIKIQHFKPKYGKFIDDYFSYISAEQLQDESLWGLLIRQFHLETDDCDEGWRGEFWGKLMRGACMVYSYSREENLYNILRSAVEGLLKEQDESGRITTYSVQKEFSGWDMWTRKYVMLGLEYFYDVCEEEILKENILNALNCHATYIMQHVGEGEGKISINATSRAWGAVNSVSIIQPFVKLYKLTKVQEYLEYAKMLIRTQGEDGGNIFQLAYKDEKAPGEYPITKAYEIISCFEGLLEFYEVTKNKQCLDTCIRFANKILQTEFTLVGGSGCRDEYFDSSTEKQVVKSPIHKQETCVTVTLMKFLANLYQHTGDVAYIDAIETAFLNLYLGALNTEKNEGHLARPIFYSYSPIYNNPRWTLMGGGKNISSYAVCGCCVSIGAAGIGVLPSVSTVGSDGELFINMFFEGEYSLHSVSGEDLFQITTDYPYDGNIHIEFSRISKETSILRLRKPAWCEAYRILHNGHPCSCQETNGYIRLSELIVAGDTIDFLMEMPIREVSSETVNPEISELFALVKGPIVLCVDSKDNDLEQGYQIKADKSGHVSYRQLDNGSYVIDLKTGGELILLEYKSAGKHYYEPRNISVWLQRQQRGGKDCDE